MLLVEQKTRVCNSERSSTVEHVTVDHRVAGSTPAARTFHFCCQVGPRCQEPHEGRKSRKKNCSKTKTKTSLCRALSLGLSLFLRPSLLTTPQAENKNNSREKIHKVQGTANWNSFAPPTVVCYRMVAGRAKRGCSGNRTRDLSHPKRESCH